MTGRHLTVPTLGHGRLFIHPFHPGDNGSNLRVMLDQSLHY